MHVAAHGREFIIYLFSKAFIAVLTFSCLFSPNCEHQLIKDKPKQSWEVSNWKSVAGDRRRVASPEEDVGLLCQLYQQPPEVLLLTELEII